MALAEWQVQQKTRGRLELLLVILPEVKQYLRQQRQRMLLLLGLLQRTDQGAVLQLRTASRDLRTVLSEG